MGPRPELTEEVAPASEKDVAAPDAAERKEVATPEPEPPAAPLDAPPQPAQATEIQWTTIIRYVCRYTGLVLIPILLLHVPRWALPRALGMQISSAQEFWDHCNRGDTSLEDPHNPAMSAFATFVFTFAIIPVFWVMPNDALPEVHGRQDPVEYAEARRRVGKVWPRQFWGGLWAALVVLCLVMFLLANFDAMDREETATNMTTIYTVAFAAAAGGIAHQAYALDAAWANSRLKVILGAICVFAYFFVCQMLAISSGRILDEHKDVALVGLLLTANGITVVAKQLTMRGGGDVGLLGFVTMGVGASVGINLRQYVFYKPNLLEAFVSSMLSAGITLIGHVMNFFVFKYMTIHPRAIEAHEAILFSDQVYEVLARVISMLVLTITDTRFYTVGKTGFGEQIDAGLVMVNFVMSLTLHGLVTATGISLMYKATSKIKLAKFAESYKARHAALALACLVTATLTLTIGVRFACVVCLPADHRDAYTCFDP